MKKFILGTSLESQTPPPFEIGSRTSSDGVRSQKGEESGSRDYLGTTCDQGRSEDFRKVGAKKKLWLALHRKPRPLIKLRV